VEVIEPWNEQTPRNLANGLPPAPWGYTAVGGASPKEHGPYHVGTLTRGVARARCVAPSPVLPFASSPPLFPIVCRAEIACRIRQI